MRRGWLLGAALAVTAPLLGATAASAANPPKAQPTIPDFSGIWTHRSLPGFEPPASGPGPVTNRSRLDGVSNYGQLVGDYTNPILKPWAAQVVKKFGQMSLAGVTYPNPANQCWPEPVPFIYKNFVVQMIQQPNQILILYDGDDEMRRVRLNVPHPAHLTPSWHGDSVGHYEGDTLVIDTIGTRTDRPYAMIDLYGTPYTRALHVVERYRLLDYDEAKEGLERDAKENFLAAAYKPNPKAKYLQVKFTVEDQGAFTEPWSATITYRPGSGEWPERTCAENVHDYLEHTITHVPVAVKPDF
jgi:hypothetical protein